MRRVEIKTVTKLDRGMAYGECCFETLRVIDGAIFEWPAHWRRLCSGMEAFGIDLPDDHEQNLHAAVLHAAAERGADALVRLTLSGGEAPWGLQPPTERRPVAHIQAMPSPRRSGPARLYSMPWPFPLRPKPAKFAADYADTLRAIQHQHLPEGIGPLWITEDASPLLLSGMTANLLLYRDGAWHTPAGDGILPGVVRGWLRAHAGVVECECPAVWLRDAEAMALCNSGHFIRPVAEIDGRSLDAVHPALRKLQAGLTGQAGVPPMSEVSA